MTTVEEPCAGCGVPTPTTVLLAGHCYRCRAEKPEVVAEHLEAEAVGDSDEYERRRERAERVAKRREERTERVAARAPQAATGAQTSAINVAEEARRELARRELARRRYLPFVQRFNPEYIPGWVHVEICEKLEQFMRDVEAKLSPRLMIFMPPRHGKSELTSKTFASWVLGHHPTWEFIQCSYSGALANKFSRNVRGIMRDPLYHTVFETRLSEDSQSVEMWETKEGGGLLAAGVGGPITGNGAHILAIDDPVKNREDAESAPQRENVYDWYSSTAYTRLAPGGGILVIQTRWHDDDLSGRLLKKMVEDGEDGEKWDVVVYPAIALKDEAHRKKGEALHPERYSVEALNRIRRVSERDWWALYQQQPVADEGAYFTRDMFQFYHPEEMAAVSNELRYYATWDLAIGQNETNDYSVGLVAGLDRAEDLWLVDLVRGRMDGSLLVEAIIDLHLKWNCEMSGLEHGQIHMSLQPFLERRIAERRAWNVYYESMKTGKRDKPARARSIQGMAKQGKVRLPHPSTAPWVNDFINELLRFPAGVNDDQVDAFAWMGLLITEMAPTVALKEPPKKSWRDKLNQYNNIVTTGRTAMSA